MKPALNRARYLILILATAIASLPGVSICQSFVLDLKKVRSIVEDWTDAHNDKNLPELKRLYADEVIFYGKTFPKTSCLDVKSKQLVPNTYFQLEVITQRPIITVYSAGIIKVAFTTKITSGSTSTNYDSYLLLKQVGDNLLIIGESDLITDSAANFSPDLGTELKRTLLPNTSVNSNKKEALPITDVIVKDGGPVTSIDSLNPRTRNVIVGITLGVISLIMAGYVAHRQHLTPPSESDNNISQVAKNGNQYLKPRTQDLRHYRKK